MIVPFLEGHLFCSEKYDLVIGVASLKGDNLIVFYYLRYMALLWEWPYQRGTVNRQIIFNTINEEKEDYSVVFVLTHLKLVGGLHLTKYRI
jgi:hypothetical protein